MDLDAEFSAMDTTNSGVVTKAMMLAYVKKKGITMYTSDQLTEYFDLLDKNNNGVLDKQEFGALFEVLQANSDEEVAQADLDTKDLTADMQNYHSKNLVAGSIEESFVIEKDGNNSNFYVKFEQKFDNATAAEKLQTTSVIYLDKASNSFGFGATARDTGKLIVTSVTANATKYGMNTCDVITAINGSKVGNGDGFIDPEQALNILKDIRMTGSANNVKLTWVTLNTAALASTGKDSTTDVVETFIKSEASVSPTSANEVQIEVEVEKYCADMDLESGGMKLGMNLSFNKSGDSGSCYAVVTEVTPDSMAAHAGFQVHDIIKAIGSIGGESLKNLSSFNTAIKDALAASSNTHITVTVGRLMTEQFIALKNRKMHNPSFWILSHLTLVVILFKMTLFVPFIYASILLITYGAQDVWHLLLTGAALIFLIEVDKVFYDKLVSGSEKAAMVKDLNAGVMEDENLKSEYEQLSKITHVSKMFVEKTQPTISEHELSQFGKAIQAGSRNALNQLKTELNAEGSIKRAKRISVHFPPAMSLGCFTACSARDFLSFEHTDQCKMGCHPETTAHVKQEAPTNIFTYAAWKITECQISWPLFFKVLICMILQWATVLEIIAQYKSPMADYTCDDDSRLKIFTLLLVSTAVYFCGMNDVYESMISLNLICWPEHYKDYDGAFSTCYDMLFPQLFQLCCNGCQCITGGFWTIIINVMVTFNAFVSSAPMTIFWLGVMVASIYLAIAGCD